MPCRWLTSNYGLPDRINGQGLVAQSRSRRPPYQDAIAEDEAEVLPPTSIVHVPTDKGRLTLGKRALSNTRMSFLSLCFMLSLDGSEMGR